jgi:dipeptidyl aminopeptidase/acylaminoacyl peptidase
LDERFSALAVSRSPFKPNHWGNAVEVSEYEFFLTKDAREQFQMWAIPRNRHWWNHSEVLPVDLPAPLTTLSGLAADPRANRLFAIGVEPTRGELVRFEPSSGRSSPCLPGVAAKFPDVSRDGKWVAYTDMEEGSLWISQFDGSGRKELASSFEDLILPKWSPDGSAIAFAGRKPGSVYRVYVVSRDGGLPREASSGEENQGAPTWSPDGKWLMYADTMCPGRSDCAVHRIELATGKIETIPGSKGLRTARWSPDGRYIAAIRPETHQLLLFDFAKQTWNQLSDLSTGDDVSWSHDSRYVYWNSPVGEKPAILRVSATGGIPETVVDMKQFGRLTGVYDAGLCVAPDDSVILLRRVSSSEIYAADWSVR